MAEANINLGVKVDMGEAEKLSALPKTLADRWGEVRKVLLSTGGLSKAAQERTALGSDRIASLQAQAKAQGGFTPDQRREYERSFRDMANVMDRGLVDQIRVAKLRGKQLEQEVINLSARLSKAVGKERGELGSLFGKKYDEMKAFYARGGERAAVAESRNARTEFLRLRREIEDEAALIPNLPPPPDPQEIKKQKEFGLMGFMRQFGRGILGASVIGGAGYLTAGFVRQQFRDEVERGIRVSDLSQRLRPDDMSYDDFRRQTGAIHPSFTPEESTRFVERYGELAGANKLFSRRVQFADDTGIHAVELEGRAKEAATLTRRLGLTPEEGAQQFGAAARLGLTDQGQQKFAELIGRAVAQGQMRGRQGEVFESILRLGESVTSRTGRAMDVGPIAGILGRFGATGEPGLQGQYGANIIERIDAALGNAQLLQGNSNLTRAIAYSTFPGKSPAEIEKILEQGLSGNPEAGSAILRTAQQMGSGSPEFMTMILKSLNIPLTTGPKILDLASKNAPPEEMLKALRDISGTPESKIREDLAGLKQQEAALVRELIPAYQKLIRTISDEALEALGIIEFIRKKLPKGLSEGLANEEQTKKVLDQMREDATDATVEKLSSVGNDAARLGKSGTSVFTNMPSLKSLPSYLFDIFKGQSTEERLEESLKNARKNNAPADTIDRLEKSLQQLRQGNAPILPEEELDRLSRLGERASGLSRHLIRSTIQQESRGDPDIRSRVGATGLMQLMPDSFPDMTKEDMENPEKNVIAGSRYLRKMINRFGGSTKLGLAAYNAGPEAVDKYGGIPPFNETQDFVNRITRDTERRAGLDRDLSSATTKNLHDGPSFNATTKNLRDGPSFNTTAKNLHDGPPLRESRSTIDRADRAARQSRTEESRVSGNMSVTIAPFTITVKNEKGEKIGEQTVDPQISSPNVDLTPGGTGMWAATNSPFVTP